MKIALDDLKSKEIADFLEAHLEDMRSVSPPESKHALDLDALRSDDIVFWSMKKQKEYLVCGAIKIIDDDTAEIKSMRVSPKHRKKGLGDRMLRHIIEYAESRGLSRLVLETGSMDFFEPARRLYLKYGFEYCAPFGDYVEDDNSVFMVKRLPG